MVHDVGAVEDFREGQIKVVQVDRRDIGILRWRGGFFALRNVCPHLGAPLCLGEVGPALTGTSDLGSDLEVDNDKVRIVCPWHRWDFDARTGRSFTGRLRAMTYPVTVKRARVMVDTNSRTSRTDGRPPAAREVSRPTSSNEGARV
jgi:nitrite reductase (NADH) small subunit